MAGITKTAKLDNSRMVKVFERLENDTIGKCDLAFLFDFHKPHRSISHRSSTVHNEYRRIDFALVCLSSVSPKLNGTLSRLLFSP